MVFLVCYFLGVFVFLFFVFLYLFFIVEVRVFGKVFFSILVEVGGRDIIRYCYWVVGYVVFLKKCYFVFRFLWNLRGDGM